LLVEELKEELNLRFERLYSRNNDESTEEKALFVSQFKGMCRNCGRKGIKQLNVCQDR
jgi:hypothetical protein